MSEKGMRKLAADDLIPEVKNVHLDKCANCLTGKQNRTSFQSRPPMRREALLQLVHTDVCSVDMKSHSGGQYFVTFIDDHSRKLWAYVLKTMDQVLSVFKDFHARTEVESCPDRQWRRVSRAVRRILPISRYSARVYNVEDAGGKRTIMERVRCMLAHAKLSKIYWDEALIMVVYIINRSPSVPLEGDMPQRVWSCKEVSYRHMRVFGCLAYVHVAKNRRGKLDPCIFLGYGEDEFGYQL